MALPSSGAISISAINTEMGRASNASTNLNETPIRKLAGVLSGAISLSNFYGKARLVLTTADYMQTDASSGGGGVNGITVTSAVFTPVRCTQGSVQIWGLAYGDGSVMTFQTSSDGGTTWTTRGSHSTDRDYTLPVNFDATINRIRATWNGGAYVARSIRVKITQRYVDITL